jgi:hypothetical protein
MDIPTFKSAFNGGTRSNRFLVSGYVGVAQQQQQSIHPFHIRATFIPPITNITLTMNAFGRKLNIPGDREYAPWQITVYDDFGGNAQSSTSAAQNLWYLFSGWHDDINQHTVNESKLTYPNDLKYKQDWKVQQLNLKGDVIKTFIMEGCWPKTVSDIDFNMTRRNFLNTFSVIMLYDSIRIPADNNGGGSLPSDPS